MGDVLAEVTVVVDNRDHPRVKVRGDEVVVRILAEVDIVLDKADAERWLGELRREARKAGVQKRTSIPRPVQQRMIG